MSNLPAADVLLGDTAAESLAALERSPDPKGKTVARRARTLRQVLLRDCLHGEVVGKSAIPSYLKGKYPIENLYVEDLPDFWRLLYTIVRQEGKRYVLIIEIVDHRTYSRWFPGQHG